MYKTVAERTFQLISWRDTVTLANEIDKDFDSIKINWLSWKTDTTSLETISMRIMNLQGANYGQLQLADNSTREYIICAYLDPMGDVTIYFENPKSPIDLERHYTKYTQLNYEIYIDGESGYSGISVSNPVIIQIEFLKKI